MHHDAPAEADSERPRALRRTSAISRLIVRRPSGADLAFILLSVLSVSLILWLSRHGTFFHDEWSFIGVRNEWSLVNFMRPHNEHWVFVPLLVYNTLFRTVGLGSYLPYMLLLMLTHLAAVAAVYALMRERNGALPALAGAAMLLFLGSGFEDLLWAFQMGFVGAAAAGAWALALALHRPTRRRMIGSAVLLALAVATQGTGLFFVAALIATLGLDRRRWRDLWIVAPAVVLYGVWYLTFGSENIDAHRDPFTLEALLQLPGYVSTGVSNAIGHLTGLGDQAGLIIFVLLLGATAWHVSGPGRLQLVAVAGMAGLVAQFAITGLVRAQLGADQATAPRYVYIAAMFLLIILSGWIGRRFARPRLRSMAVLVIAVALSVGPNIRELYEGRDIFEGYWLETRATVMATEQFGGSGDIPEDASLFPVPERAAIARARDQWGYAIQDTILPAAQMPPPELIDAALYELAEGLFGVEPVEELPSPASAVTIDHSNDVSIRELEGCVEITPVGPDPFLSTLVPGGKGLGIAAGDTGEAHIFVSLLGPPSGDPSLGFQAAAGRTYVVRTPDVGADLPWRIRHDPAPGSGTTRVCIVGDANRPATN